MELQTNDYSGLLSCRIDWFDQCGRMLHLRMWICQYGTHWSLASSFQCCFESSGIIYILTFCMWPFPLLPSLYLTICRTWFFSLLCWNDMCKVLFSSLILGTWVIFSINKLAFSSGKFPYVTLFIISFLLLSLLSFSGISVFQSLTYRIVLLNNDFCLVFFIFWPQSGACGVLVPQLGIEKPHPLHWKLRVLTIGPPGKSPYETLNCVFFF